MVPLKNTNRSNTFLNQYKYLLVRQPGLAFQNKIQVNIYIIMLLIK